VTYPTPGWIPPPPPPTSGRVAIRPGRVFIGIGIALAGHLLTVGVAWLVALLFSNGDEYSVDENRLVLFLFAATIAQVVLMVLALAVGITLAVRNNGDGGIGVGIVIGWAIGLIISPVVGFGVCVALLSAG
jgi:hypothetical protein